MRSSSWRPSTPNSRRAYAAWRRTHQAGSVSRAGRASRAIGARVRPSAHLPGLVLQRADQGGRAVGRLHAAQRARGGDALLHVALAQAALDRHAALVVAGVAQRLDQGAIHRGVAGAAGERGREVGQRLAAVGAQQPEARAVRAVADGGGVVQQPAERIEVAVAGERRGGGGRDQLRSRAQRGAQRGARFDREELSEPARGQLAAPR